MSPDCTSSTVLRPSTGPRSNRYGGLAVASANSRAAGSNTMGATVVTADMFWSFRCALVRPDWVPEMLVPRRRSVIARPATLSHTHSGVANALGLRPTRQSRAPLALARGQLIQQLGVRGRGLGPRRKLVDQPTREAGREQRSRVLLSSM